MVVDVTTVFARLGVLSELLYADELVLMSEIIKGLGYKLLKWKEVSESKILKLNLHFIYLGDMVSTDGGCEAAVTARTRCGWVKFGSAVSCCMTDFL